MVEKESACQHDRNKQDGQLAQPPAKDPGAQRLAVANLAQRKTGEHQELDERRNVAQRESRGNNWRQRQEKNDNIQKCIHPEKSKDQRQEREGYGRRQAGHRHRDQHR